MGTAIETFLTMDTATFLLALRRNAGQAPESIDPVEAVEKFLKYHGDTGEGRLVRRIWTTLVTGSGEYSEAELYGLSSRGLSLVAALFVAWDLGQLRKRSR